MACIAACVLEECIDLSFLLCPVFFAVAEVDEEFSFTTIEL